MYILVQAITSFLKSTGLSAADVLGQEELCDTLLRYHVLPYDLKSSMIVKKDSKAQTLEPYSYLLFNKDSSGVTVKDMQGNVAKVAKGDISAGEATLHSVDRVLLSGMGGPIACLWSRDGTALVRGMVTAARPLHTYKCSLYPHSHALLVRSSHANIPLIARSSHANFPLIAPSTGSHSLTVRATKTVVPVDIMYVLPACLPSFIFTSRSGCLQHIMSIT